MYKMCRCYDPVFSQGHIKDELGILVQDYQHYCFENNLMPKAGLYMNEITYWELCEELNCVMVYQSNNTYGKIYGYNIRLDNRIAPHVFELREEDKFMDNIHLNFGGRGYFRNYLPTKYIINDGAIILFWGDGTKTIVKRAEDDAHDIAKGFLWAYFQKYCGMSKTKANKYLANIVENNTKED